jgi:type IV secretion system protein VirB4
MSAVPRVSAARREISAADRIPYAGHVAPQVIKTLLGDYVQVFRLSGASFECADDETLNGWHERLNILWRNIASPQIALWSHVLRRREMTAVPMAAAGFAGALERKYRGKLRDEKLMVNELYVSTVYRPTAGLATGLASKLLKGAAPGESALELADALDACVKLRETLRASLARYDPDVLSLYTAGGRTCSAPLSFFSALINGEVRDVPLPRAPLREVLATSRVSFGTEALEYRLPRGTRVGAMLGIK